MRFLPKIAAVVCALGICFSLNGGPDDSIFGICDELRTNVDFWKKIFSEVSLSEGLIHDANHPLVIFKKLKGDPSEDEVNSEKEIIVQSLKTIENEPESTWSAVDHPRFELYKTYADSSAIAGASERVRFQQGQRERFIEGLERSGLFLDTIKAIFRDYRIPERIAYLPHVESSFNTAAHSRAGAAGLWQFMRSTGRDFGMKIDYAIDERKDPVRATVAAARYLSKSYAALSSWPLAITSYNHGIAGIKRAVARTGSKDLCTIVRSYSSPSFQFASSNFYCCFLAASELARKRADYFTNVELSPPLRYNDITLMHYVTPSVICAYLKIPPERLAWLNPAIRQVIFERDKQLPKGLSLHIPEALSPKAAKIALALIPDSLTSDSPERPARYRVKRGENLGDIAARFGVTIGDLALENNIRTVNRLLAGQTLLVPVKESSRLSASPASTTAPSPAVKSGDQAPVRLIRKYNKHLDLAALRPGDTAWIPIVEEKDAGETAVTPERKSSDREQPLMECNRRIGDSNTSVE